MNILEERILQDGILKDGNILIVDSFLNHQIDIKILEAMAGKVKDKFKEDKITKVLTIESSGIAIGTIVAQTLGVPLVFAKKNMARNLDDEIYETSVASYTYKNNYPVAVAKKLISKDDNVLIVDDFLAEGNACYGLIDIVNQAGANVAGISIAIEKGFQNGGRNLRADGYKLFSMAIIENFTDGQIIFR